MQLHTLTKRMILTICTIAPVIMAAAVLYYRSLSCMPFVLGVLLGAVVSIIKVLLLGRVVNRAVDMERKAASAYASFQHLLRFALTGAVLLLGAFVPAISLWGAVAGVLTYQVAAYSIRFKMKP